MTFYVVAAFAVMVDGLLSATFGHGFVRWLRSKAPERFHSLFSPFMLIPEPLFRAGALLQAVAAAYLIARSLRHGHQNG